MDKKSKKKISRQKKILITAVSAVLVIACAVFLWNPSSSSSSYMILEGHKSGVKKVSSDTYTIGVSQMSSSIHPYAQDNQATDVLRRLVYHPLLVIREDQSISYMLAKEVSICRQGTQIDIVLKEGNTFSDGAEVTAQSVKEAYEWHQNPASQSSFASQTANIKDIQVKDQTHLTMTLNKAVLRLPELFTIPLMHCVPSEGANGETFAGCGSYKISELIPLSDMTLVPVSNQTKSYDEIHISVMNYENFDEIVKNQSTDMFMIGKEGYMEKLKESKAYDVYAMQEQEGMYLVFQDSDVVKDAAIRRFLAGMIATSQAVKNEERLPAQGITSARKKGTVYSDTSLKKEAAVKELRLKYPPSTHSRSIAEQIQKQLQEQNIKVTAEEYNADTVGTADACLYTGTYSELFEAKDMNPFYRSLEDQMDIRDYDDRLESWLYEQSWFVPIDRQTTWTAALHGRDTLAMFE